MWQTIKIAFVLACALFVVRKVAAKDKARLWLTLVAASTALFPFVELALRQDWKHLLFLIKTASAVCALGFALWELFSKKKRIAGLVVSTSLAMCAQVIEIGVDAQKARIQSAETAAAVTQQSKLLENQQQTLRQITRGLFPIRHWSFSLRAQLDVNQPLLNVLKRKMDTWQDQKHVQQPNVHHFVGENGAIGWDSFGYKFNKPHTYSDMILSQSASLWRLEDNPGSDSGVFSTAWRVFILPHGPEDLASDEVDPSDWLSTNCDMCFEVMMSDLEYRRHVDEYFVRAGGKNMIASVNHGGTVAFTDLPLKWLAVVMPFHNPKLVSFTMDLSKDQAEGYEQRLDVRKERWIQKPLAEGRSIFWLRLRSDDFPITRDSGR
jgi:hypothetical protein